MVLVILAAIWAAVLLPPWLENRRSAHPSASVVDFRHQLAVLNRTVDPYAPAVRAPLAARVMTRVDVRRRRRDVLTTLVAAAGLTMLLALVLGGTVWLLQLTVDALLLGYVALLLQVQQHRADIRATVRYLPQRQAPDALTASPLALRRVAR